MSYEAENLEAQTDTRDFEDRAILELTAIRRLLEILVGFDINEFNDLEEDDE